VRSPPWCVVGRAAILPPLPPPLPLFPCAVVGHGSYSTSIPRRRGGGRVAVDAHGAPVWLPHGHRPGAGHCAWCTRRAGAQGGEGGESPRSCTPLVDRHRCCGAARSRAPPTLLSCARSPQEHQPRLAPWRLRRGGMGWRCGLPCRSWACTRCRTLCSHHPPLRRLPRQARVPRPSMRRRLWRRPP
jgi:hypothetical protein